MRKARSRIQVSPTKVCLYPRMRMKVLCVCVCVCEVVAWWNINSNLMINLLFTIIFKQDKTWKFLEILLLMISLLRRWISLQRNWQKKKKLHLNVFLLPD